MTTLQDIVREALTDIAESPEAIAVWYVEDFRRLRAHIHGYVKSTLRHMRTEGVDTIEFSESSVDATIFTILAEVCRSKKDRT